MAITSMSVTNIIVRSPFRAKHHVVVQYMARWMKCLQPLSPLWDPLPPVGSPLQLDPPQLDPPSADSMTGGGQGGPGRIDEQGRIDDITDAARDFALQLP